MGGAICSASALRFRAGGVYILTERRITMAKINPKNADESVEFQGFGGIRQCALLSEIGAFEMRNFRIRADGSLEKRCGYRKVMKLPFAVRGVWQGTIGNTDLTLAVSGVSVYRLMEGQSSPTTIYFLSTSSGAVRFCKYADQLYLLDGNEIYRYLPNTNSFTVSRGYAPLYGANWHPTQLGDVNEPLNLFSPRLRIRYLNSIGATQFMLPYTTRSIDRMEINGTQITNYTFTAETSTFSIPSTLAYGVLDVSITISSIFDQRSSVTHSSYPCVFYNYKHEDLFLYGNGYRVFHTDPVDDEMLLASRHTYSDTDPLYFPSNGVFYMGDTNHPVRSMCQRGNRLLAFNDNGAWGITRDKDDILYSYAIEGSVGCRSYGGMTLCGESPVVVHADGIYRVTFPVSEPTSCSVQCLSSEIRELLPDSLLQNGILCWLPDRNELWLRDPTETEEGLVWVYNFDRREWSQFDQIPASLFFSSADDIVGFATRGGLVALSDSQAVTDDGQPINAHYQSHFLSLKYPENRKRAWRVTLCADPGESDEVQTLIIETDRASATYPLPDGSASSPTLLDYRLMNGRFRFLRFRLDSPGSARPRFYRVSVLTAD